MLLFDFKNIESLYLGKQVIQEIRKGTTVIWEAIKGCFGSGFWKNNKGWINKEGWRNIK